jgi:hypothetical protein
VLSFFAVVVSHGAGMLHLLAIPPAERIRRRRQTPTPPFFEISRPEGYFVGSTKFLIPKDLPKRPVLPASARHAQHAFSAPHQNQQGHSARPEPRRERSAEPLLLFTSPLERNSHVLATHFRHRHHQSMPAPQSARPALPHAPRQQRIALSLSPSPDPSPFPARQST